MFSILVVLTTLSCPEGYSWQFVPMCHRSNEKGFSEFVLNGENIVVDGKTLCPNSKTFVSGQIYLIPTCHKIGEPE